ncbi:MAG TPA: valine--tRNA ligase, partial [Candidatus Limnocylindria bacterium]|nr:valine--tRNA ligase [Candidatus Limnocylindria bacterium]
MKEQDRGLAPAYDPAAHEAVIYARWMASGAFTPAATPPAGAERFVITMPPPNVTGSLHTGHALFVTLEDILTRYHRMRGDDTLWLPGVDHASIAAQFVLDRVIAEEGESRASLGRERYLERMWRFMDETRDAIGLQMRRMGASADWTRNLFTMDPMSARAVRTAFKRLDDAGLVYRGEALVNWCPRCRTTISDLENVHREETGILWTLRYHLARPDGSADPDAWISVATTRPETILGDTGVAVHPDDERYAALVGREAILPFLGRRLPIVADPVVERDFGTGAVKITPAHDPEDYATGQRHGLAAISVLDEEARVTEAGGEFAGMDRYEARQAILTRLRAAGDLEAERPHPMAVGHCDRCGTVIEPRLSVQWFIRMESLAAQALASVREGRTRIAPQRFEKVFAHWMENIHDWAVGRQLWWGHRIPAWFCPDGHVTISDAEGGPDACSTCGRPAAELRQETDIFDTWFSSGLWPFSTLGWPDETPDFRRFYPTSVMETGYDIIFFWVARMMMLGLFCTGVEPFHTVYLHGLVRLEGGSKMSKTKGNVLDPLEVIDQMGADALRFALISSIAAGSDQRMTPAKLEGGRNLTNKLWNAARFVVGARPESLPPSEGEPSLAERWIGSRLAAAQQRATASLDAFDFAGYASAAYDTFWSDYCDWFLELAKVDLRRADASAGERARTWRAAAAGLAVQLRLLHPLLPFVTEAIWEALTAAAPEMTASEPLLMRARWPVGAARDQSGENDFSVIADLVRDIRNLRTEARVPAGAWIGLAVVPVDVDASRLISGQQPSLAALARVRPIEVKAVGDRGPRPVLVAGGALGVAWLTVDPATEAAGAVRRTAHEQELGAAIDRLRGLLAGPFSRRAPAEVVARE